MHTHPGIPWIRGLITSELPTNLEPSCRGSNRKDKSTHLYEQANHLAF